MESLKNMELFSGEALAASGTLTSPVIDLENTIKAESIFIKASSVLGVADVKVEYAVSKDGVNFGGFNDATDIITSTNSVFSTNKEGVHTVAMPAVLSRYIKLRVTELSTTVADTLVDLDLLVRNSVLG